MRVVSLSVLLLAFAASLSLAQDPPSWDSLFDGERPAGPSTPTQDPASWESLFDRERPARSYAPRDRSPEEREAAARSNAPLGYIDRTGSGEVVDALSTSPVDVGFMPGIRINITAEEVWRQEGGLDLGHPTRYLLVRYARPGLPIHSDVTDPRTERPATRMLKYEQRRVFGYDTDTFDYWMNPNTGLYDTIRASLFVPGDARPDYYAHFEAVVERVRERVGEPTELGLYTRVDRARHRVTRANVNAATRGQWAIPTAVWKLDGLHIALVPMPIHPHRGRAPVLTMLISVDGYEHEAQLDNASARYLTELRPIPWLRGRTAPS